MGRIVRNVCSDADKMEAIGLVGIERCLQYSAEVLGKKGRHCDITAEVSAGCEWYALSVMVDLFLLSKASVLLC